MTVFLGICGALFGIFVAWSVWNAYVDWAFWNKRHSRPGRLIKVGSKEHKTFMARAAPTDNSLIFFNSGFNVYLNGKHSPIDRLTQLARGLIDRFDGMPLPIIQVTNESVSEDNILAYACGDTHMFIKYDFYYRATEHQLREVLLHELTHNWIHWKGIQVSDAHGEEFQNKLREVTR